jgi:hypothetical protein
VKIWAKRPGVPAIIKAILCFLVISYLNFKAVLATAQNGPLCPGA